MKHILLLLALPSLCAFAQDLSARAGEKLPGEAWGPIRYVDLIELTELEKDRPVDRHVHRMRGDAHGEWVVPSESTTGRAHSGTKYITNKWGDTIMGVGFPDVVDVDGAWIVGQTGPTVWAESIVVVGYRDGEEVDRSPTFTAVSATPTWFELELDDVDRIVFECSSKVGGAAWFGLDDLTYSDDAGSIVLDFEDLEHRDALTGSGYQGLRWEEGTGVFDDVRVIEQPLTTGEEEGEDPIGPVDDTTISGGGGTEPTLLQDFKGAQLFDPGANFIPPDTCGVVAPSHFVEVVNTNLSIYERSTQARVVNVSLDTLFGTFAGDPRVAWDHFSDRCIILATDFDSRIYLAVSLTSDPTGSYFTTSFQTDGGDDGGRWPDYPTLGFDSRGIYTGLAQFGGSPVTMTIFALDKDPLVDPNPSLGTITAYRKLPFESAIQPTFTYGDPGRQYFISREDSSGLRLREVVPPLTSPTLNDLGVVSIPSHGFPPDVPALGSVVPLDSVDYRPMNSVYRAGSIWAAHAVDVDNRAAVRWYQVDTATVSTSQLGTVDDPLLGFIMPSITVNADGDVVMGFSGASPLQYAGAYYTGRKASDPAGEMAIPVQYKPGEGPYQRTDGFGRNRWGDYSLTSVDPVDDLTFWTVQEYAQTDNNWGTWMAELTYLDFEDCNDNGVPDSDDIANGTSEDCDGNGVPDECDPDADGDGIPDDCELGTSYCGPAVQNSTGLPAVIDAVGSDLVADDDVTLLASQMPPNHFGYFLTSQTQGFVQNPGGSQGNLCLGGTIGRYAKFVQDSGPDGAFSLQIDLSSMPPSDTPVMPGETWNFQSWFRDTNPNQTSNFTDGLAITFQ